jgi:hypothetical protein
MDRANVPEFRVEIIFREAVPSPGLLERIREVMDAPAFPLRRSASR